VAVPTDEITVIGPAGGVFVVLTTDEQEYFENLCDRYTRDYAFQNVSDLADLERVIQNEVLSQRFNRFLGTGFDYWGDPVSTKEFTDAVKGLSLELRGLKKALGIDRISRKHDSSESVSDYVTKLLERAREFSVMRNEQTTKVLTVFMELRALVTLHDNCLSGDTEVLTSNGVVPIATLADLKATVLSKSGSGRWVEAEFKSFGMQPLMEIVLKRNGATKLVRATPGHRWYVNGRIVRTDELDPGMRLDSCWGSRKSVRPSPQGVQAGIVYGDGSLDKRQKSGSFVVLCGLKNEELLKWFPNNEVKQTKVGLKICDLPRSFKSRPSLDESRSYLYGWLAGYFAADGTVDRNGSPSLSSTSFESLKIARNVCYLLSIPTLGISSVDRISNLTGESSILHRLSFPKGALDREFFLIEEHRNRWSARTRLVKSYVPDYEVVTVLPTGEVEEVFCAVVPEFQNFTLADNLLSGNCTEEERRTQGAEIDDILQWLRDYAFPEFDTIDAEFINSSQRYWVQEM